MNIFTHPRTVMDEARSAKLKQAAGREGTGDGDGSVQVHRETEMDAGKA
ncbi:MAG: hypothetical protein RID59_14635 [Hoeflea sp.]